MAVVEISKIQVRRGQENLTGVPILDGGEFGWASDTEHLYIGLRRVDGGSRDANVRILTENDLRNFFQSTAISNLTTSTLYTFEKGKFIATSGTNITSSLFGSEIVRFIQDKLDDFVSIKDFGAVGDGVNSDGSALQTAIDNMFLTDQWKNQLSLSTGTEKVLYLPKGDYLISQTIYIPAKTKIVGEGMENTRIILRTNDLHFFKTIDGDSVSNSPIHFDNTASMGSPAPDNICIENLTLKHEAATAISTSSFISLDVSANSVIRNVKFTGAVTTATTTATTTPGYVGVNLRGYDAATTEHVVIENCVFENLYAGIKSNYDVRDIVINNNTFDTLFYGVDFNNPIDTTGKNGPRYVKITNNNFNYIHFNAIHVGNNQSGYDQFPSAIISQNNRFGDSIGYHFNDTTRNSGTSIIYFATRGNISQNDYFERERNQRIDNPSSVYYPLVNGKGVLDFTYSLSGDIPPSNTATIAKFPITDSPQFINLKYMFNVVNEYERQGQIEINIRNSDNPIINLWDNYTYEETVVNPVINFETWEEELNPAQKFYALKIANPRAQGTQAVFTVTNSPITYTGLATAGTYSNVAIWTNAGTNYLVGDTIELLGRYFTSGTNVALDGVNSVYVTVTGVTGGGSITSFSYTGTAANIVTTSVFYIYTATSVRLGGTTQSIKYYVQPKIMYS